MIHMAVEYMAEGHALIVLDPHEDLINDLLTQVPDNRVDDVVLLDVTHDELFGINPFYTDRPEDTDHVGKLADQILEVFRKNSDSWGAILEDLIPNAAQALLFNPGYSMLELPDLFGAAAFRARLTPNIANLQVRRAWENEYNRKRDSSQQHLVQSTVVRIRQFTRRPVFARILGQARPTVDFDRFIAERKIVLIKLSRGLLGRRNVGLLGSLILQQLMNATFDRAKLPREERHPVVLFCDEFQLFATETFAEMIEECGKGGLRVVLANQNFDQGGPD
jgi:hypothetical protein